MTISVDRPRPAIGSRSEKDQPLDRAIAVLTALVTTPIVAIVATLLYFDARIRNEGFDLQVMALYLEGGAAPA